MTETEVNVKTSEKAPAPRRFFKKNRAERFPWQRLTLSLIGIGILLGMWRWATFHLYVLPEHSVTSFTSISNNTTYAIAALVIFFVTGRLVYEWKNQTISEVVEKTQHLFEKKEEKIDKTITHNVNIVEEGQPGAPEKKPWSIENDNS